MISDLPHIMKIRLAPLTFFCWVLTLQSLCPVGCLSLAEIDRFWFLLITTLTKYSFFFTGQMLKRLQWPLIFADVEANGLPVLDVQETLVQNSLIFLDMSTTLAQ